MSAAQTPTYAESPIWTAIQHERTVFQLANEVARKVPIYKGIMDATRLTASMALAALLTEDSDGFVALVRSDPKEAASWRRTMPWMRVLHHMLASDRDGAQILHAIGMDTRMLQTESHMSEGRKTIDPHNPFVNGLTLLHLVRSIREWKSQGDFDTNDWADLLPRIEETFQFAVDQITADVAMSIEEIRADILKNGRPNGTTLMAATTLQNVPDAIDLLDRSPAGKVVLRELRHAVRNEPDHQIPPPSKGGDFDYGPG